MESIATFEAKFDGNAILGATYNPNGSFAINYFVDASTSLGNHTVSITVVDNKGKSSTKSVIVEVTATAVI